MFCGILTPITQEHTRHKVKASWPDFLVNQCLIPDQFADYPGLLPYKRSRQLFAEAGHEEPPTDQRNVRGTLVIGLNDKDIALLDLFEGDVRTRRSWSCYSQNLIGASCSGIHPRGCSRPPPWAILIPVIYAGPQHNYPFRRPHFYPVIQIRYQHLPRAVNRARAPSSRLACGTSACGDIHLCGALAGLKPRALVVRGLHPRKRVEVGRTRWAR